MSALTIATAFVLVTYGGIPVSVDAHAYADCGPRSWCDAGPGVEGNDLKIWGGDWDEVPPSPTESPEPEPAGGGDESDPATLDPPCLSDDFRITMCPVVVLPDYPDTIYNTDLIRFTPPPPTATTENAGLTLTATPITITTTTNPQTQTGTLLGHPVTITFTPASTTIDYGDTTTAIDTNTNTAFTHTYTTRGTYTATLTTQYTATVTFPNGVPRPVTGTITSPTTTLTLRALTARTSLTHTPCTTTPHPPHC